jgi:hypothetical protein
MYSIVRNKSYDFLGESYASKYPNLHKYPATMLPQIGIKALDEFEIKKGIMLDPYCGSGSSFAAGIEMGFKKMHGFDLNPLAILISNVKFTKINIKEIKKTKDLIKTHICEVLKNGITLNEEDLPNAKNLYFWFSRQVLSNLTLLKKSVNSIKNKQIRDFFWVPLSGTIRDCSYTRNSEFKLFKMKEEAVLNFNPDVISIFFDKLSKNIDIYENYYFPKIGTSTLKTSCSSFCGTKEPEYDVILTSPPYGDSKTTVAYGQFSTFSNEWMGFNNARSLDGNSMGGKKSKVLFRNSIISEYIDKIHEISPERALEVSSFYFDLSESIKSVSKSLKIGGKSIYVVGNRNVKGLRLPTDQFIAEQFTKNNCSHIITYERLLTSKSMPLKNSPTNISGAVVDTMNYEYIVVNQKVL